MTTIQKLNSVRRIVKTKISTPFGITGKQWLASAMICALLSPMFAVPAIGANRTSNVPEGIEPVNRELPVWAELYRDVSNRIEEFTTKYRPGNAEFDEAARALPTPTPIPEGVVVAGDPPTDKVGKPNESAPNTRKVKKIRTGLKQRLRLTVGETIELAAMPLDRNDQPVQGLSPVWKVADPRMLQLESTTATALKSGRTKLTVVADNVRKTFSVEINDRAVTAPEPTAFNLQIPQDEQSYLFTAENNLGKPFGQVEPSARVAAAAVSSRERAGIADFSFTLPIFGLSGRGVSASIGATYNSRVWTKSQNANGNHFIYDVEENWLAPGFNVSLGYLDVNYPQNQSPVPFSLTDPDGTRHQLVAVSVNGQTRYETTDGSFISVYDYTATFPGGTKIRYWTDGTSGDTSRHFPTSIIDRHGNMIHPVYKDTDGRINYIVDTLGRYIRFHYDSQDRLVAVTVPSYAAGPNSLTSDPTLDRQAVRFYYDTLSLQYQNRFDGDITVPNSGQLQVLKYVYYPGTKTGYKYDYSSYYGMIYRITSLRGMEASTDSLTTTGTVSEGQWAAWTKYNYPGTDTEPPASTLTDMPKYNKRIDEWVGRTDGGSSPETFFSFTDDTTSRTTTITTPDGAVSQTVMKKSPGAWDDGLIMHTLIMDSESQVLSKTKYFWEQGSTTIGGRKNPRVGKIETTNDAGLTKATVFEFTDPNNVACAYNNVCQVKEHDYAAPDSVGTLLRNTVTTYETGANYINNGLLSLVKSVRVVAGGTTVARTDYNYDTQSLYTYSNNDIGDMYDRSYNPATGSTSTYCEPNCSGTRQNCCYSIAGYDSSTGYRGNVTEVKQFADATNDNDPLAKVDFMKYDNVGNLREASVSCCNTKKWTYSSSNKFAWPVQVIDGDSGQLTTYATYDYNTGLTETSVNANGQTTDYQYESDTLRQKKIVYPNGGYVLTEFSDKLVTNTADLVPGFVRTTTTLGSNTSVQNYSYYDGRGMGIRSASEIPSGWNVSVSEFDKAGRFTKSFNPYVGSTPTANVPSTTLYTQVTGYDALGRALAVQLQDGAEVTTEFSTSDPDDLKKTWITSTDPTGRQRRMVMDALGRTVRVDEPNPSGVLGDVDSPNQPTYYEYDGNNNLTKVTQSDGTTTQERLFKYDSLSRLTHERQVEANATLNDAGTKVTSGGLWTKVLNYDEDGLLTDAYDANGVHTTLTYDGLNRLSSVGYSGESGHQTPTVTYTYDQARSGYYNAGALTTVTTAIVTGSQATPATETLYDYDSMGRLVKHQQTIGDQSYLIQYGYNLAGQLTSETYPSGRVVTTGYDSKGRLSSVSDAQRTFLSSVSFGNNTLPSQIAYGNTTVQNFAYNDRLQATSQELKRGSEVLQKYEYGFGELNSSSVLKNNGKLESVTSRIGTDKQWSQKFQYDSIGRLKEAKETKGDTTTLSYKQVFEY